MIERSDIAGLAIGLLEDHGWTAARDVIADAFSRFEPMAVAVGQSYSEFQALVGALLDEAAIRDLTVCARLGGAGDIIGVMLATDVTQPMPERMDELSPSFAPIGGLLEQLDSKYRERHAPGPGECLHLAMLAVDQAHGSKGVGQALVAACLDTARARGFRSANTMATNRASQRVFAKLGFAELFSVAYSDYTFAGEKVFAGIAGDDRTALMARTL